MLYLILKVILWDIICLFASTKFTDSHFYRITCAFYVSLFIKSMFDGDYIVSDVRSGREPWYFALVLFNCFFIILLTLYGKRILPNIVLDLISCNLCFRLYALNTGNVIFIELLMFLTATACIARAFRIGGIGNDKGRI